MRVAVTPDCELIVRALGVQGCVALPAYFPNRPVREARAFAANLLSSPAASGFGGVFGGDGPHEAWVRCELGASVDAALSPLLALVADPSLEAAARAYLGPRTILERLVVHRAGPARKPLTDWHAGQEEGGRRSVQIMVYLADTSPETGPFSYALGSHHLVAEVTRNVVAHGGSNMDVHSMHRILDLSRTHPDRAVAAAMIEIVSRIQGSDFAFQLPAPAGTAILFDTAGIHRGSVVSAGERWIVRAHYFERPPCRS